MYLEYINDLVHAFKAKYSDPYILFVGDWNQADTSIAFEDFPFLQAIPTPPRRGDEVLEIVFTNISRSVVNTEVCPPLILNRGRPGRPSDHNIVVV